MANNKSTIGVIGRMLNERSPIWEVTPERLEAIYLYHSFDLSTSHKRTLELMYIERGARWIVTSSAISALYALMNQMKSGDFVSLDRVISRLKTGSAMSNVGSLPWLISAISELEAISRTMKSTLGTKESKDDQP